MIPFIFFLVIFLLLCAIPFSMWKYGTPLTGRDLFFVFVGMLAIGNLALLVLTT